MECVRTIHLQWRFKTNKWNYQPKFKILHHILTIFNRNWFQTFDLLSVALATILSVSSCICSILSQCRRWCFMTNIQNVKSNFSSHRRRSSHFVTILRRSKKIWQSHSQYLTAVASPPTPKMSSVYLACVLLMVLLSTLEVESYSAVPSSPVSKFDSLVWCQSDSLALRIYYLLVLLVHE